MIKTILFILLSLWCCTNSEAANYADYVSLFPIEQRLKTQSIDSLTSAELQTLTTLSGNANAAQVKARAITEAATHTRTYQEALPIIAQERSSVRKPRLKNAYNKVGDDVPNIISIFPNPAKDYFSVETPNQNGTLCVYNTQGVLIIKTNITQSNTVIPTIDWASGMYLYEYTNSEQPIIHGKLQIIH